MLCVGRVLGPPGPRPVNRGLWLGRSTLDGGSSLLLELALRRELGCGPRSALNSFSSFPHVGPERRELLSDRRLCLVWDSPKPRRLARLDKPVPTSLLEVVVSVPRRVDLVAVEVERARLVDGARAVLATPPRPVCLASSEAVLSLVGVEEARRRGLERREAPNWCLTSPDMSLDLQRRTQARTCITHAPL